MELKLILNGNKLNGSSKKSLIGPQISPKKGINVAQKLKEHVSKYKSFHLNWAWGYSINPTHSGGFVGK